MDPESVCGRWHFWITPVRSRLRGLRRRLWRFGVCWEAGRVGESSDNRALGVSVPGRFVRHSMYLAGLELPLYFRSSRCGKCRLIS